MLSKNADRATRPDLAGANVATCEMIVKRIMKRPGSTARAELRDVGLSAQNIVVRDPGGDQIHTTKRDSAAHSTGVPTAAPAARADRALARIVDRGRVSLAGSGSAVEKALSSPVTNIIGLATTGLDTTEPVNIDLNIAGIITAGPGTGVVLVGLRPGIRITVTIVAADITDMGTVEASRVMECMSAALVSRTTLSVTAALVVVALVGIAGRASRFIGAAVGDRGEDIMVASAVVHLLGWQGLAPTPGSMPSLPPWTRIRTAS
jgi:hypothetical protein